MKKLSKRTIGERIVATILAWVMIISILPMPSIKVNAATTEHPGCVTITVTDSGSNPLVGANVAFTVEKDPDAVGGEDFTTISGSETTDEKGVVVVLDGAAYEADLLLSATISMNGYVSSSISSMALTSAEQNFDVSLTKPEIQNVVISVLDGTYNDGTEQDLITNVETTSENVTIEYSTDGSLWSSEVPKGENAGDYPVYVKITKDGYQDYLSGQLTAKIAKKDIEDISILANNLSYNGTNQNLVNVTGAFKVDDVVTWIVNDDETTWTVTEENISDLKIPAQMAVSDYTVQLKVNRGANYNEFSQTVTAKIKNGDINLGNLKITGLRGEYTGSAQQAVIVENVGDYTLQYKMTADSSVSPESLAWDSNVPEVTNAGSYIVWVQAIKDNYDSKDVSVTPAEGAVVPYNVYIAQKTQTITFNDDRYNVADSEEQVIDTEDVNVLAAGKNYTFTATGEETAPNYVITYEIDTANSSEGILEVASISTAGILTITAPCQVTVKATISEVVNAGQAVNYAPKTIQCMLTVEGVYTQPGSSLILDYASTSYVVGNQNGITHNKAKASKTKDKGDITFSIENATNIGLNINSETGAITVVDYGKLVSAVENEVDGTLVVSVKINKARYRKSGITYAADEATYPLNITLHAIPSSPYTVYSVDDMTTPLTVPNGDNNWYNTAVSIVPATGYKIIRADELNGSSVTFGSKADFGQIKNGMAQDQGEGQRVVYLQNATSYEITGKIVTSVNKLDNVAPANLTVTYQEPSDKEGIHYYDKEFTVEFVAYDTSSGIKEFQWEYTKDANASDSILSESSGTVSATQDATDPTKYIASISLPKNALDQMRGNLTITMVDNAGNIATVTDSGVFVLDTISPELTANFQLKEEGGTHQTIDKKHYFSDDVLFNFKINEANFYGDDVKVSVSKNGSAFAEKTLQWSATGVTDENAATLELTEDGDYEIKIEYTDRSGKEMTPYKSDIIVVDKITPVIEFEYKDYTDDTSPQTATLTITEHNFRKEDVSVVVEAKDICGTELSTRNFENYLRTCEWTSEGDKYTVVLSDEFVDAIYKMTFNYKDLALKEAVEVVTDTFIVDHMGPQINDMSVEYSTSLKDTVLSTITLGFYNPEVTVTFVAHDSVSGVDFFIWNYQRMEGASEVNVEKYDDAKIVAIQDSNDKTKFTASVTLPKAEAEQLKGSIAFRAIDKYSNQSEKLTDSNQVIVVDTIAPELSVEYTIADNIVAETGKQYYNKSLTATFTVTEANFYEEDIKINLKKNENMIMRIRPEWEECGDDVYKATYTIEALENHSNDGDYVFDIQYTDKSNNQMTEYISDIKVIDTTKPEIIVEYSNNAPKNTLNDTEGKQRKYFADTIVATVTVLEHNFYEEGVDYKIVAKDAAGAELGNVDSLYSKSEWIKEGDKHILTLTYPGDANYTFDIECRDLAILEAEDYTPDYFTVDKTKPTDLKVSYSAGVLDTILANISFGFYNAKAVVTVSATDNISGINAFKYSYLNAAGVSNINAQLADATIEETKIAYSNGKGTGSVQFEIPREALGGNNQFNGTVKFSAIDRSGNESNVYGDSKRIVVDNIAPTANVQYNAPVQVIGNVSYYDGPINASVVINEANFYAEDVHIEVTKDGATNAVNATWASNGDLHTGTFNLNEDGDYSVRVTYMDKSNNTMQEYVSEPMTIDTDIVAPTITINGSDGNGKAFKDDISVNVNFEDTNYESYEVKLYRISYAEKNVDVTDKFVTGHINTNATGGNGTFATFEKNADNDGIYTLTVMMRDKAGHTSETSTTFTVNRFGSVYEYSDYLVTLIQNGGAYVQGVTDDLVITEYNADRLVANSLNIEISKDGKPLDEVIYEVTPEINDMVATGESGWFQYAYIISKDNFNSEGIYKISVSSKDETGNSPENNNYKDKEILFRVDRTVPEITSITGLEKKVINATENEVKYTVFDAIGIKAIAVYVNDKPVASITDFSNDANNYAGSFILTEDSNAQKVRIVVTDLAGNITDTSSEEFTSLYAFNDSVTVSTNVLVRWYADKTLFFGSIIVGVVVIGGGIAALVMAKRKKKEK